MDRRVLEERRRRKRQQLLIRRYTKIGVCVAAVVLLLVFLIRGVIGPLLHKDGSDGNAQKNTEQTATAVNTSENSTEISYEDDTSGGDISGGTESDAGETDTSEADAAEGDVTEESSAPEVKTSSVQTSSTSSLEAIRSPLKGAADLEKAVCLTPGWHTTQSGTWYQNPDGTYYTDGFMTINGIQYSFGADGYIETGWITKGVKDYYFNEDGSYNPDMKRPMLCLTFDDGPGQYTLDLLNCLEENGAHATFFMVGTNVEYFPDEVKRMVEVGCELGNHSWDHPDLLSLGPDEAAQSMQRTDDALMNVVGQESTVCRAPYGNGDQDIYDAVGKPFILWSLDSEDWRLMDADADYDSVMNGDLTDGSIILMHDIHEPSVEAAKRLIPDLVAKGYRLVTISEMAEAKNVKLQSVRYTDFWQSSLNAGIVPGYNIE